MPPRSLLAELRSRLGGTITRANGDVESVPRARRNEQQPRERDAEAAAAVWDHVTEAVRENPQLFDTIMRTPSLAESLRFVNDEEETPNARTDAIQGINRLAAASREPVRFVPPPTIAEIGASLEAQRERQRRVDSSFGRPADMNDPRWEHSRFALRGTTSGRVSSTSSNMREVSRNQTQDAQRRSGVQTYQNITAYLNAVSRPTVNSALGRCVLVTEFRAGSLIIQLNYPAGPAVDLLIRIYRNTIDPSKILVDIIANPSCDGAMLFIQPGPQGVPRNRNIVVFNGMDEVDDFLVQFLTAAEQLANNLVLMNIDTAAVVDEACPLVLTITQAQDMARRSAHGTFGTSQ